MRRAGAPAVWPLIAWLLVLGGAAMAQAVEPPSPRVVGPSLILLQPDEDAVRVDEMLLVRWPEGSEAPATILLPDEAEGAAWNGAPPAGAGFEGRALRLAAPEKERQRYVQFRFFLPVRDAAVRLAQATPTPFDGVLMTVEAFPWLRVTGAGLTLERKQLDGHDLWVAPSVTSRPGGRIELRLEGWPRRSRLAPSLALGLVMLVAAWGIIGFVRAARHGGRRKTAPPAKQDEERAP